MVNTQLIVLKLILASSKEPDLLEQYEKLKTNYFNNNFAKVYTAIGNYYNKFNTLPTLGELTLSNSRDKALQEILGNIEVAKIPEDITLPLAVSALLDEYAQLFVLNQVKSFLHEISFLSADEIVTTISELSNKINDEIETDGHITTGKEIQIFKTLEEIEYKFIQSAINQQWNTQYMGIARQELILAGGYRGTGKSVLCANFAASEYQKGNIAPYYTIEMTAEETQNRIIAILAGVDALKFRNQTMEGGELIKLALTRSRMFVSGSNHLKEFLESRNGKLSMSDFNEFEKSLIKLPLVHPLIIYDDSQLKISSIDVHLSALRTKYGDKLTMAIVDYLNQLRMEGVEFTDRLDWKNQIHLATALKSIARKNDCVVFSPYQVTETGEARLSKGVLDSVDTSIILNRENYGISLTFNKVRGLPTPEAPLKSCLDWASLKVNLHQVAIEEPEELEEVEEE